MIFREKSLKRKPGIAIRSFLMTRKSGWLTEVKSSISFCWDKWLNALLRKQSMTGIGNSLQKIVVVTGPILPKKKSVTIGTNQVTVPTHYYKVIFDLTPPRKMIGFILPNEGSDEPLATFAVTVDAVEKATGLNFFSRVPKEKQESLERTINVKAWKGL